MINDFFYFMKYVNPTWYFNLKPKVGNVPYFIDYRKLGHYHRPLVDFDKTFSSEDVSLVDASFLAWNRGVIENNTEQALDFQALENKPTLLDNYNFIKKYYNPIWTFYILLVRLVTFKNPFKEIPAYIKSLKTNRVYLSQPFHPHDDYRKFKPKILESKPKVSIILPTLNRYKYLKDAILDLGKQTIPAHEIIVIDQTDDPDKKFYEQFNDLPLQLIFQDQKGQWLARNKAIQQSTGDYILMFDDDSRVDPDWTAEHLKAIEYFGADICAGVSLSTWGAAIPENYSFFRWADQFDSGNALIKRNVFQTVGLFDRHYDGQRMGDGEFGLRAYLNGFKSISSPTAKRIHLKVPSGGLRQMGSWDGFRPKKLLDPRPIPSVVYLFRKYFGKQATILSLMTTVPPSIMPYKFKKSKPMLMLGFVVSLFFFPVVLLQVNKSWKLATEMIEAGDRIEKLD